MHVIVSIPVTGAGMQSKGSITPPFIQLSDIALCNISDDFGVQYTSTAAKAACQIKQRASGPETAYECVFTKLSDYRCHRVTCLEVDSGCSQLTIHIHSGALHQQPAKAEQTTAASTGAAAAAADAGTTHWYEHKVRCCCCHHRTLQ